MRRESIRSGGLSLSLFILCAWIESCRQMVGDNYALEIVSVIRAYHAHARSGQSGFYLYSEKCCSLVCIPNDI
jgi:hypothetical protein